MSNVTANQDRTEVVLDSLDRKFRKFMEADPEREQRLREAIEINQRRERNRIRLATWWDRTGRKLAYIAAVAVGTVLIVAGFMMIP
jgi:hypothetical protein